MLQWGRRSASTETHPAAPSMGWQPLALQWGRRSASTETLDRVEVPRQPVVASMGPSISVDGDGMCVGRPDMGYGLQWGRRSASTETPGRVALAIPSSCFNGAVDQRRRRPSGGRWRFRTSTAASMGPSISVDGDNSLMVCGLWVSWLQWGRRSASTETTPSTRSTVYERARLQWGRRSASTETEKMLGLYLSL